MKPALEQPKRILRSALLGSLPPEWPEELMGEIREAVAGSGQKVVVIDDDPTGTQTVHGVPVLTEWSVDALAAELKAEEPAFYILTNSRSLSAPAARGIQEEIGRNLIQAGQSVGRRFVIVSRSDSTLRGHFPAEIDVLEDVFDGFDVVLLIPFFEEGGRYTINDVHYVTEGNWLVPVGQTQFARDAVFGYRSSNLREWVEEKYEHQFEADAVDHIPLDQIRQGGPHRVAEMLMSAAFENVCVVNAASRRDLEVVVQGILRAEAAGRRLLYRTAASFVPVRAGIPPRPLLTSSDLGLPSAGGGLVLVGSYVTKSSEQLNHLLLTLGIKSVELCVDALLSEARQPAEMKRAADAVNAILRAGGDVVLYTSRLVRIGKGTEENVAIGHRISESLVEIVRSLEVRPRYLLAKGGITSSDIATRGLGVKRAIVLGQVLPGIPVWKLGAESRHPDLIYIVFPGNVGGPEDLADIVSRLRA